jgi:excisionase family DNA binding protein
MPGMARKTFENIDPIVLSVEEVARLLSLSTRSIWKLLADGSLPRVQLGRRRTVVPLAAVRAYVARRTVR